MDYGVAISLKLSRLEFSAVGLCDPVSTVNLLLISSDCGFFFLEVLSVKGYQ